MVEANAVTPNSPSTTTFSLAKTTLIDDSECFESALNGDGNEGMAARNEQSVGDATTPLDSLVYLLFALSVVHVHHFGNVIDSDQKTEAAAGKPALTEFEQRLYSRLAHIYDDSPKNMDSAASLSSKASSGAANLAPAHNGDASAAHAPCRNAEHIGFSNVDRCPDMSLAGDSNGNFFDGSVGQNDEERKKSALLTGELM